MKRLPKPLSCGSKLAVVAPSSPAPEAEIENGLACLRGMGFEPVLGASCRGGTPQRGYLAGESDRAKVDDLHRAFADPAIDGIVCLRGGSGAGRLIRFLNADAIAAHPKVFVGFSDITILHAYFAARCGFVTFHGPLATSSNLREQGGATRRAFLRALTDPAPWGEIEIPQGYRLSCLVPGACRGELAGGNLALLCTTIGTSAEIDTAGKIVLLEDVNEAPYSVDRMLNHLLNAGKLADAAGILLGEFTKADPPESAPARTVEVVFRDVLAPLGIPLLAGFPAGHGRENLALPLGAEVAMDAAALRLSVERPVLSA